MTANGGKPLTVHLHISDDFHQVVGSKIQWTFRAYPIFLVLWWASSANLYIETDYWKVKTSLHWPYTVFCRSGVTYCRSTKCKFIPPKRHVEQAGIKKHQNNHKFRRKMPWLPSLIVQVTFTVKQPARFGLGAGADPRSGTAPRPGNAEVWGLLLPWAQLDKQPHSPLGLEGVRREGSRPPRVTWMPLLIVDANGFTAGKNTAWQGRRRWLACGGLQLAGANARQGSVLDMVSHLGAMVSGGAEEPVVNHTQRSGSDNRWRTCTHCLERVRESKPLRLMLVRVFAIGKHYLQRQEHSRRIFRK